MWCVKRTPPSRPIHPPPHSPILMVLEALLQQLSPPSSCIGYLQHQGFQQQAAKRNSLNFFFGRVFLLRAKSLKLPTPKNGFEIWHDAWQSALLEVVSQKESFFTVQQSTKSCYFGCFVERNTVFLLECSLGSLYVFIRRTFPRRIPFVIFKMITIAERRVFAQAVCECVPLALFDAITWLGYCNSTMNPIIYPLFMRDFKRALGKLLPCCSSWSTRRPSPALSLSLRNSGDPNLASSPPSPLASDLTHQPATATDAVNLLDAEHAGIELPLLLPNQVDTLDWNKVSKCVLGGFLGWKSRSKPAGKTSPADLLDSGSDGKK